RVPSSAPQTRSYRAPHRPIRPGPSPPNGPGSHPSPSSNSSETRGPSPCCPAQQPAGSGSHTPTPQSACVETPSHTEEPDLETATAEGALTMQEVCATSLLGGTTT